MIQLINGCNPPLFIILKGLIKIMTGKPISLDTTGKRIKYLRKQLFSKKNPKRKLSQEEFSEILDCNKGTVVDWEADTVQPDTDNLIKLADFFGVSVDYLLCRIDEKNHDLKFVCEYTGLSEESVLVLRNMTKWNSESDSWNNDIDYFLSLCGEDFAFYLSELRYNRMQAVINQKSGSSFAEKSNNLKLKNNLNFTLYSFLQYCNSIPEKLFDLQHIISDLEKQK